MKLRISPLLFGLAVFIEIGLGSGCSSDAPPSAILPPTPIPGKFALLPRTLSPFTSIPGVLVTPLPTLMMTGPTGVPITPYRTAMTVQADAVAFVVNDWEMDGLSSLHVANVDGSGEKRLVDNLDVLPVGNSLLLQWSPNGKWISFRSKSKDELWLISPDGSEQRKISFPDKNKGLLYAYQWSPDGSQIAYILSKLEGSWNPWSPQAAMVAVLNVTSGDVSELTSFESLYYAFVSWLPNGKHLLLGHNDTFSIVDATSGKIIRELPTEEGGCSPTLNDRLIWSTNSQWFVHVHHGTGFMGFFLCISGVDGTNRFIDSPTTSMPVWDKTGNYLYFAARNIDPSENPNFDPDQRLMRYTASTGELVRMLTLGGRNHYGYVWSVSLSPNGRTLETHTAIVPYQQSFLFFDLDSHSTSAYTVDLQDLLAMSPLSPGTDWSSDNQNVILFAGELGTPNGIGSGLYGAFYTINIHTGKAAVFSGDHWIGEWVFSPRVTNP